MNILNFVLTGIIIVTGSALAVVLENNVTLSNELELHNKLQVAELIETFKEKYSDHEITEYPDSKGMPYKYVAHTNYADTELLLEKDRIVLKAWNDEGALCIVSNPIP